MKINNKTWLWIIALLLVSNLVLVGFFYLEKPSKSNNSKPFLEQKLDFTKEQTAAFKLLLDQHEHLMRQKQNSTRVLKDSLFEGLSKNRSKAEQSVIAAQIGALEASKDMATYEHFQQVRELCNDEQKLKFDRLLRELLRPPGRGPGGPPNDRMGPPPPPGEREGPPREDVSL